MDAREVVLDVQGLSVDIATPRGTLHAVRDVSFQVRRGETLCIVGESGCGKSITSLAIMSLLPRAATRQAARLPSSARTCPGPARGASTRCAAARWR